MLDTSTPPSGRLSCQAALRPRRAPDPILVVAVEHEMVRPRPYPTVQIHSVPMRSEAQQLPVDHQRVERRGAGAIALCIRDSNRGSYLGRVLDARDG